MKRMQKIFLISILITIASIGVSVFLMFFGPDAIEISGKSLKQIFENGDGNPIIIVMVVILVITLSLIPFARIILPRIIKNGEDAKAKITKVWDTGTTINDDPQIGLQMDYVTKEGARIQAETKTIVSRLQVSLVKPGVTANIIYNPAKPNQVQVKGFEVEEAHAESAEDRLEQLSRLREKGMITETEYQAKRNEIIKSI